MLYHINIFYLVFGRRKAPRVSARKQIRLFMENLENLLANLIPVASVCKVTSFTRIFIKEWTKSSAGHTQNSEADLMIDLSWTFLVGQDDPLAPGLAR